MVFEKLFGRGAMGQATDAFGAVGGPVDPGNPWSTLVRNRDGVPELGSEWVRANTEAARLIDCREPEEFTGDLGHIARAELVPLHAFAESASKWDRTQAIVVVCRSGGRSGRAALLLEQLGFTRVASMAGGMLDWNARHLPVER